MNPDVTGSLLAVFFSLGVLTNCDRELSVDCHKLGEETFQLPLWPLRVALPLGTLREEGGISVQEGGSRHGRICLLIIPEPLACWSQA